MSAYPDEFVAWLLFRRLVDIVLGADLVCYFVVCVHFFEWPENGLTFGLVVQVSSIN